MNDFVLSYNRCPPNSYEEFEKLVVTVLDRHALLKTAIFRGNSKLHCEDCALAFIQKIQSRKDGKMV